MHNFWTNFPNGFLGKLTGVKFVDLLCSIILKKLKKKIRRVNHEIHSLETLAQIGQNLQGFPD